MNTKRPYIDRLPRRTSPRRRRGISMLELVIAGSMLAAIMTSLTLVLRTARSSWDSVDTDYGILHQGHSVTRHVVRAGRESVGVDAIGPSGRSITLRQTDGSTIQWAWHSVYDGLSGAVVVTHSATGTNTLLAHDIASLQFVGYQADGTTAAGSADETRLLRINAQVRLPRSVAALQNLPASVWIRSW